MYKHTFYTKVPLLIVLATLPFLCGCQSDQAQSPEQQRINTMADNVKAVEQEEQMEETDGNLYDQSTLADPDPAK